MSNRDPGDRTADGGPTLVVYGDYVCPFCRLADALTARLQSEGVTIEWCGLELRPAPAPLPDPRGPSIVREWRELIEPLARELGVAMRLPEIVPRTRKAHEAAAFAADHDAGDAMHDAIFRAYFEEGRDIGRIDVLVELGRDVGLDVTGLKVALDIDQYTERVLTDQEDAFERGIYGVPAFRSDDEVMIGFQTYDVLRRLLQLA